MYGGSSSIVAIAIKVTQCIYACAQIAKGHIQICTYTCIVIITPTLMINHSKIPGKSPLVCMVIVANTYTSHHT